MKKKINDILFEFLPTNVYLSFNYLEQLVRLTRLFQMEMSLGNFKLPNLFVWIFVVYWDFFYWTLSSNFCLEILTLCEKLSY